MDAVPSGILTLLRGAGKPVYSLYSFRLHSKSSGAYVFLFQNLKCLIRSVFQKDITTNPNVVQYWSNIFNGLNCPYMESSTQVFDYKQGERSVLQFDS